MSSSQSDSMDSHLHLIDCVKVVLDENLTFRALNLHPIARIIQ